MTQSPRLLLCAATLSPGSGGVARVARLMLSAAAAAGVSTRGLCFLDEAVAPIDGVAITAAKGRKANFLLNAQRHSLWSTHVVFDSVGIARARARILGLRRPYAVFMHGIEAWEALRPEALTAFREAQLVFVNSAYTLARHEALHGPLPQARVCPLATQEESPALRAHHAGPPTALIVGRIEESELYKGHDALIAAWPAVVAAVPAARLVIAGGGTGLARIRALAAGSPASAQIEVLGFVPEAQMPALWARADAFAMPSRGEGFGLVYVEAMRLGLPVIASTHDAGAEVNIDGETGLNVDLDRPGALAAALIAILGDRERAQAFGTAGQARWARDYRADAFRARFMTLLERFLAGSSWSGAGRAATQPQA